MSAILNNVFSLLNEAEIELDDKFITLYEAGENLPNYMKSGPRMGKPLPKAEKDFGQTYGHSAARMGDAAHVNPKIDSSKFKLGDEPKPVFRGGYDKTGYDPVIPKGNAAELGPRVGKSVNAAMHGPRTGKELVAEPESMLAKGLKFGADNSMTIAAVSGGLLGAGLLAKYHNSIMRGRYLVNHYGKLASSAKDPASKAKYTEKLNWAKNKLATAQAKARTEHKGFIEKSQSMKSQIAQLNKAGRKDEAAKLSAKLAKRQAFLSKIGASI